MNAAFVIDKPPGLTSHDVVNRVRRVLGQNSVGHLGTLDPSATGVLPVVVGNFTRLSQFYTHSEKAYEGVVRFGFSTDTYDADGDPTSAVQDVRLDTQQLEDVTNGFRGTIQQVPPPFSAKKIAGVPAYKLARKKQVVELKPVEVEVREFEWIRIEGECAHFRARVSGGTYLRSLAHNLGQKIGCGAHLAALRRTAVAEFAITDAHTLDALAASAQQGSVEEASIHPRRLLPEFPCVTASDEAAALIRHGRAANLPEMSKARLVKIFYGQRELIAIGARIAGTLFHPQIVFTSVDSQ